MLELQRYLIKERVAFMKTTDKYDIFDPDTQKQVGVAEERVGTLVSLLRWVVSKKLMPTTVEVCEHPSGELVFTIRRPVSFWRSKVYVADADGRPLGHFESKFFSLGGGFWVYDDKGEVFAEIKGKWHGWEFKFVTPDGDEVGAVTKKWAGLGKELFTSADNYVVTISDDLADQPTAKTLLLAAALAIDIVYYEQKG